MSTPARKFWKFTVPRSENKEVCCLRVEAKYVNLLNLWRYWICETIRSYLWGRVYALWLTLSLPLWGRVYALLLTLSLPLCHSFSPFYFSNFFFLSSSTFQKSISSRLWSSQMGLTERISGMCARKQVTCSYKLRELYNLSNFSRQVSLYGDWFSVLCSFQQYAYFEQFTLFMSSLCAHITSSYLNYHLIRNVRD